MTAEFELKAGMRLLPGRAGAPGRAAAGAPAICMTVGRMSMT